MLRGMVAIEQLRSVRNDALRLFVEAWLLWRGDALLPHRGQLDLNRIKRLLPGIALLDVHGPEDVRYRVAGTRLVAHLGFDPTGRNYKELTPPGQWPVRSYRVRQMVARPCAGAMHHEEEFDLHRVVVGMLTLPLLPDAVDGRPLLLSYAEALEPLPHPADMPLTRVMRLPDRFTFVDIGAGVPETTEPPPLN